MLNNSDRFIVGSDFDGTLAFRPDLDDSDDIRAFREKGNIFGCVTGRPVCNTVGEFTSRGIEYDFIASMNGGAAVTASGEVIFDGRIDGKILPDLLKYIIELGAFECGIDADPFKRYRMAINHEKNSQPQYFTTKPEEVQNLKSFCHIAFRFDTPDMTAEYSQKINERFGEYLDAQYHHYNVNCPKRGLDKGEALARVAEFYGIPPERTYAVGDNTNDLPMLLRHRGFTVEDAFPTVREAVPICGKSAGALLRKLSFE